MLQDTHCLNTKEPSTKLAVTTPSESPAGGEGARITLDEEKQIALSQLQELEVAIKVRKVTKVDGRKIRWIEYRARKQAEEEKQSANSKKRPRRSRSKTKGVENNENEANVNNNNSSNNSNNNNNINNNNNSIKTESTMKVEPASPPASAVGTSNVLESMKQQFLQGTENVEEPSINGKSSILAESSLAGQKRKSGRTRKSTGTSEGGSPSGTSPKKLSPGDTSPKGASLRSGGASKGSSSANNSLFEGSLALSSTSTTPLTSDQPLGIGIKKNFFSPRSLTKGLREIRKMENGSDGVPTVKTEENKTPASSPSASLPLRTLASVVCDVVMVEPKEPLDVKPPIVETKSGKATCPLIKAAAKLMSQPTARSKFTDNSSSKGKKGGSQKGSAKKVSTKSGVRSLSEPRTIINGHTPMVQNGSEEVPPLPSPAGASGLGELGSDRTSKPGSRESSPKMPYDPDSSLRRPRGRPPKKKVIVKKEGTTIISAGKSGKKLATLVVDVHNTMNGEPQTVIPVSRPVLRGKRTSSSKNPRKKVTGKTVLELSGSSDIKRSPAPSPKRQKNSEAKTSQSGSASADTKKGKTNKKNNDQPVVIKEEKDNTSASSINQTQGQPDHTHSTKLTKSLLRTAYKEVAPEIESNTAISCNPPHKKKKVKKPVLKVKTLPTKHKEIKKIVKKSKKVTSIGASKQKKAQPKKIGGLRKYLSSQKGKTVSKANSNKKGCSQIGLKISGAESEGQGQEGVSPKQEQDTPISNLEGVQPQEEAASASLQKDSSMLEIDSAEMKMEADLLSQNPMESMELEDSDKVNQASEVSCVASHTGIAVDFGEESPTKVKPCITNVVPHNETETQMNETSTEVNILGIGQSYEKVGDLPEISFQNNNNNNNNPEEDGVVISDKEITMVKDLSAEKLSPSKEEMKCIIKAGSDIMTSENTETVIDMQENVKREEPQNQMPASVSESPQEEESLQEQKSFGNEVSCDIMDAKTEEDVSDTSKSYSDVMPNIVTLDSSQSDYTYEENMLSSSSISGMHEEKEMPVLEPISFPTSTLSPPLSEGAASVTALPKVMNELQEENILGCDKLSQSDLEEQKTAMSGTVCDEETHTTGNVDAKETYTIEDCEVMQTTGVNQTHEFVEPSDCEVQVVGVQTDTLKDEANSDSVIPESQKCSPKQVKKREGSVVRKKVKKGLIQGHNTSQLEQRAQEDQEELEIIKITKAQETSQAGAEKALESSEVLGSLPSSQKENVEVQDLIPEAQPAPLALAPEPHSSSASKTKDKVPRILKQLFQDEGVQNMLKSMSEDPGAIPETSPNSDSGMHKLRPKRVTEPMLSSSPELDAMEALFTSSRKKKRGSELDTLYIDEGVLNLLTSKEHNSRRGQQEDTASDVSQGSSSKSFKVSKTLKPVEAFSDTRKRKLSGASTASNASSSSKSLQPPEPKKVRLDVQEPTEDPYEVDAAEEFKEKPVIMGYCNLETASSMTQRKAIPVVPLSVKQKNKAIKMQLKLQKQKQLKSAGSEGREGSSRMVEVSSTLKGQMSMFRGANSLPVSIESSKSVPPIKIKLASDSVTIKPIPRPSVHQQPAEVTIVPKPHVRPPIKPQVVDSGSPPVHKTHTLPHVRTSPEKPKPHPDSQSPPSHLRRVESFPGPVPPVPGFPSLVRNCDPAAAAAVAAAAAAAASKSRQRVGGESVRQSQRASVRQSEANYHFRDIALRKFNNFTQIILSPSTTKMKNALNSRVLREMCEALNTLKRDDSVRIVLVTGTGSTFCQGVDLTALQHPNLETRKKNAENLVRGIKDFLKALVQFPKPIIAGVNGNAMGLGVTMLPLFDMVIANDKAEFCLPYAKLGQVPEGGATYTFPNLFGKLQSTQLFLGHKLTAHRAQEMGLVSESIWPATYQQELIPKVALLATHSSQSMEATKALMNHHLVTKLELSLESECRLLLQQWTSPHFAHLSKRFLDTQYIHLQKPVSLPL
ncbi:uncharacterized protein LOC126995719 isoform X2 [Eriocheir sinensis]|uniref:uncharacterized protein LOC126995719 isoform X2 n=1 Tax=Eriocheir sinensis TaxID=95602 RepID=UPI0021C91AC8|nr:uncharacterized protein LOC126995719 isoform X2 [Eriocheir sinensis]